MVTTITAETLRDDIDSNKDFTLIDTRTEQAYLEWHIKGALNLPFSPSDEEIKVEKFDELQKEHEFGKTDPIVTICAEGISSFDFAERLESKGFTDVKVVEGGMKAWSGVYDVVPIATENPHLQIIQLQRRAKGCLGYLVGSDNTGQAIAIDVPRHTRRFIEAAADYGFQIQAVFDTHIHADHISGGPKLAKELDVPYYLGSEAAKRNPQLEYNPLDANQVVELEDIQIKALHTPGHTTEMTSWLINDEALVSGDTLFLDSIGRTELEFEAEGAREGARMQYDSLTGKVLSLPDTVKVLPGHFSLSDSGEAIGVIPGTPMFSTIKYLRTNNRALQMSREDFVEYMFNNTPSKPPNYEDIIELNLGKREPKDQQEAIELELGPNRCAASEESMVE